MISCCRALQPNRQLVGKVVYFECPICEFKGDSSTNEAWAMQAWNKRVLEKKGITQEQPKTIRRRKTQ